MNQRKLYVGNMSFETTESDLRSYFEAHGPVESVHMMTDPDTGGSRGFAFVEMVSDEGALAAIDNLNGYDLQGRSLKVNVAKPRISRDNGNRSDLH